MSEPGKIKIGESKVMLGFIVRRCAADIGHAPTPDEFARWANGQRHGGKRFCLFGKEISPPRLESCSVSRDDWSPLARKAWHGCGKGIGP
jgi:hypothetical protein